MKSARRRKAASPRSCLVKGVQKMPQASALFAVARIRVLEKGLIGKERMARFLDLNAEDILRQLTEGGYGTLPDATPEEIEQLIASELDRTMAVIEELTPDPEATDLYRLRSDIHNLKILLKLRLQGDREVPAFMNGGVYHPESLSRMVQEKNYRDLPEDFASALKRLEKQLEGEIDPREISIALDQAYFAHVAASPACKKYPLIRDFFAGRADFDNILTLLRLKAMDAPEVQLRNSLLPGGGISKEQFIKAYSAGSESYARLLATGPAAGAIKKVLAEYAETGRPTVLERARDNWLISLFRPVKAESDSLYPILGYLIAREQEAKCIRLLVTAKRNGLAADIIEERMRELYG